MPYDNEMRGVLFPAEKKTEKHPDYTGNVTVKGIEYRLAAWKKVSRDGTKEFLSLSVSIPLEKKEESPREWAKSGHPDDIPF